MTVVVRRRILTYGGGRETTYCLHCGHDAYVQYSHICVIRTCMHACKHACLHGCMHVCSFIHTYIRIHTYRKTYRNTGIQTACMHTPKPVSKRASLTVSVLAIRPAGRNTCMFTWVHACVLINTYRNKEHTEKIIQTYRDKEIRICIHSYRHAYTSRSRNDIIINEGVLICDV
jgi:hypothetical protein